MNKMDIKQLKSILKTSLKRISEKTLKLPKKFFIISAIIIILIGLYVFSLRSPADFPQQSTISIESGSALTEISDVLGRQKVVRSGALFQFFAILFGGDTGVIAGDYFFEKRLPVFTIAKRLTKGDYRVKSVKVTVPEGFTLNKMSVLFAGLLRNFSQEEFFELTEGKEGFLFPDTYFFFPTTKADQIVSEMMDNFNKKILAVEEEIEQSGKRLDEIITMASLIEKESNNSEDRKVISGILWKRIEIGMLLQVDAAFLYINGKGTFDLTKSDLEIDSPYNTYKYKGLPPAPIGSPGFDAILAALNPEESPYLFYLHDGNGMIYYAKNFEEHKQNKRKYLR